MEGEKLTKAGGGVALTQYSDIYISVQDSGINRIINHIMVQRPSLFNYGSVLPATNPKPICRDISSVPLVMQTNNPLITRMNPLPVIQTSMELDYVIQLAKGDIDFYPGGNFSLPPKLSPPLNDQQFAINFEVYAGLIWQSGNPILPVDSSTVIKERDIDCLSLSLFATGGSEIKGVTGNQIISMNICGIEIPELKPDDMEKIIECYALKTLNEGILPKITDAISAFAFNAINLPRSMGSLTLSASMGVPHNPAIEDNQLKIFANFDSLTLNLSPSEPFPPGRGSTGTVKRISRSRKREGAYDFNAAISVSAFEKIFTAIVKEFRFSKSGTESYKIFSVNYDVVVHLEGGSLKMQDDGTIVIKELNVKWDKLKLDIGIDIPELCVGDGKICLIPPYPSCDVPIVGCKKCVTAPSYCFFGGIPDVTIPMDLSGLITSEVDFGSQVEVFYGIGSGTPNRWQIIVTPTVPSDLYIIDIASTVGDLFKSRVKSAIDDLLSSSKAPDWAVNLIYETLGGIDNILRNILHIPEDIGKWFIDVIRQIGIIKSLLNDLYEFLAYKVLATFEIEDPFQVLKSDGIMIPVKIPIEFIRVCVNSDEITIEGDVGNY